MEWMRLLEIGVVLLLALCWGLAFFLTDLSGMLYYYQNGGIYLVKSERRVADDTPENRRRLSRNVGICILLLGGFAAAVFCLIGFTG